MKRLLLRQKIVLSIGVVSIASLFLVGFIVNSYIKNTLIGNKKLEIYSQSIEQSHETTLILENNKLLAYMLATKTKVGEFLIEEKDDENENLTNIFKEYAKDNEKILSIYILNKDGKCLISTDPRFVDQDYSFRDYFKLAILGNSFVGVGIGKTSNEFGYYFSEPILNDGQVLGVLVVKIDGSDVDNSIISSELSQDSTVMLVDNLGIIVSSNNKDRILKSLGTLTKEEVNKINKDIFFNDKNIDYLQYDSVLDSIRKYKEPVILSIYDEEDEDEELFSIIKLENFDFYLVTEVRLGALDEQVKNTVSTVILIVSASLFVVSFIIYLLVASFLKPINKIKMFLNNISNGNFREKLVVDTKDEFNDLATRINMMAQDLSDLYTTLDNKVKEQTLEIKQRMIESENQNKAILNILEDIEKEKTIAEKNSNDLQKFKLAVDNASDQVVITDKEGVVIYGNNALERITGFKPEEALGRKAGVLWRSPMPTDYYKELWDTIKNKKKVFSGEIKNKRKNGDFYIANISISPVLDNNNEIIYFVAIEHDITREKEIDKAKTEFVSLASHQLRTPLSSINWYTEMLLAGDAGDINNEQRNYLNEVAFSSQRMVELINSLLNVSRLDLGTFIIEPEKVNIVEMIQSVISELKPQILDKKLKIEESYSQIGDEFKADRKLFRIVLQNLISNAVKYTKNKGSVEIKILNLLKGENFGGKDISVDSIAIQVSDDGIGIPINQRGKIFLKMFRADNARESDTEGTGLGLYIIKSIVDQSGGLVWFRTEENKGTAFYVVFPKNGMKEKKGEKKLD